MDNWSHIENIGRGTVNSLSNFIKKLENTGRIYFPDLKKSDKLYLFSDYSGDKNPHIISYSILVLDESSFESFTVVQKKFWKKYSLGKRIIDYKGLNDKFKQEALVPFLQLCNNLNGLIFTVLFNKSSKSIFQSEVPEPLNSQISIWKNRTIKEKFLRLREFILLILNGLGRESQSVLWVTDNDDIVANAFQLNAANKILNETLAKYLDFSITDFEIKTLDSDSEDRCLEKICSLTDLVAGGLVDFVGDYINDNIFLQDGKIAEPIPHLKVKVNPITNWLSKNDDAHSLKKVTIKINDVKKDVFSVEAYRFPEIS